MYSSHKKLEVTRALNGDKFVVDLIDNSCSCNFWGVVGFPCHHAGVALQYGGYKPKKFVHEYYSRKFYEVCYSHEVSTTNEQRLWKNDRNPTSILPPKYKKGLGRPKKIRRREPDEDPNPTKLSGKKQPSTNVKVVGKLATIRGSVICLLQLLRN